MKTVAKIKKNSFWGNRPRLYNFIQLIIDGNSNKKIIENFPAFIKRESVLDLGSGTSLIIPYLKPKKYLGLDVNEKYLEFAKNRFKKDSYIFEKEDLRNLRLPKQSFDLVLTMNVFHHLDNKTVLGILDRVKKWNKYKYLVIVDCQPIGIFKKVITVLDAGSYPRSLVVLDKLIKKYFLVSRSKNILNWSHTYQYRFYLIKGK